MSLSIRTDAEADSDREAGTEAGKSADGRPAEIPSVLPSREPGAETARLRRGLADAASAKPVEWSDAVWFAPLPPESLSRVLDGLRNLR